MEIEQGSPEWHALRLGKVTASRVSDMIARTKSGWGAGRSNLMAALIAERLSGAPAESFSNAAMQWGNDQEPEARTAYEFYQDVDVSEIAFVDHPTIPMSGCSPDGLIGDVGLVEIKCPNTSTHLDTLLAGKIPEKHIPQMLWQMACTGRAWCDFVSYDPRMPENMRLFVRRLHRDDIRIRELEVETVVFLGELDTKLAELTRLYETPAIAKVMAAG